MNAETFTQRRLQLTVTDDLAGIRVDTLLKSQLGLSGTVIRRIKWFDDGILVDGTRVTTRFIPQIGQVLDVRLSESERRSGIVSTSGNLDIVHEDGDIVVINKAAGCSVHPGPGHYDDTLGNFLLHHYDVTGQQGDFHPVHRLDRGTSGLMVVAKHPHAQEILKNQLHTPHFGRHYLAVCEGHPNPPSGTVDAPLGTVTDSLIKRAVMANGQCARTHYETVGTVGQYTLLALTLDTGRTHQIRVHMAHIGHPLVGDFLYGTERQDLIARPALHSHRLALRHPISKEMLTWTVALPEDMDRLVQGAIYAP